jgi:hypothetical protein
MSKISGHTTMEAENHEGLDRLFRLLLGISMSWKDEEVSPSRSIPINSVYKSRSSIGGTPLS